MVASLRRDDVLPVLADEVVQHDVIVPQIQLGYFEMNPLLPHPHAQDARPDNPTHRTKKQHD